MKRTLKIISPHLDTKGAESTSRNCQREFGTAFSRQKSAHIRKNDQSLNTLNQVALTISHYLNSPLTILLGKVELLAESLENDETSKDDIKRSLNTCKREILRIDAIIKSFQNLCRVQYKDFPPGVRMLDVEKEIRNRVEEISFLR